MKWYHIVFILLFLLIGFAVGWKLKPACEFTGSSGKTEVVTIDKPVPVKVYSAKGNSKKNSPDKPKGKILGGKQTEEIIFDNDSLANPCDSIREYNQTLVFKDSSKVEVRSVVRGVLEKQTISYTPFKVIPVKYKPSVFAGLTVGYNNISPAGEIQLKNWSCEIQYNLLSKQFAVGVKRRFF